MTVIRRSRPSGHSLIRVSQSQARKGEMLISSDLLISSPLLRLFVIVMMAVNPSLRRPGIITIQRILTFLTIVCKREREEIKMFSRLSLCSTTLSPLSPAMFLFCEGCEGLIPRWDQSSGETLRSGPTHDTRR